MSVPLIIAHRGSSRVAPENTLAAFRRAIDDGADGIEFDVRLASDGVPVIIHDSTLKRVGGSRWSVAQLSSEDLSRIDVGSWFNRRNIDLAKEAYSKECVPTLTKTLEALRDFRGHLYVELKCKKHDDPRPLADAVCDVIANMPLARQCVIQSFHLQTLKRVNDGLPGIATAALFAPKIKRLLKNEGHLIDLASEVGAHHLSLHHLLVTRRLIDAAARREVPVTVWTVDHPRWVSRARKLGIYALITNNPVRLLSSLD